MNPSAESIRIYNVDPCRSQVSFMLDTAADKASARLRRGTAGRPVVLAAGTYFDLCAELGILVWHDFMLANFDYPIDDPDFRTLVEEEARAFLDRIPSP